MEENTRGGGCDVTSIHVKTEAVEENTSALILGSREPPASYGETAYGGGGGGGGLDQTAEALTDSELQAGATTAPLLLYPVSTERFFSTSADGKTYLKIAPAVMAPAPSEKTLAAGSDFSSKAVLCLIEAVGRRWGLYETRERSQLFQSVQEEMASKGHVLPVEKIRRKWNNLIVTYKRVKDRSRETGHAKTSWEFFDLMDATLCDTVGSQIVNNKRSKGGTTTTATASASGSAQSLAKVTPKLQLPQPSAIIRPSVDFPATAGDVDSSAQVGAISQVMGATVAMTSVSTATVSHSSAPDFKPLLVLSSDAAPASIPPANVVPSPSFISSPCFTETSSSSPSLGSTSCTDPGASRYVSRKAPPSFPPGVMPFRIGNGQSLLGLPSLFPPASPCPTPSAPTSLSEGHKGDEEQSCAALFQEVLKRHEEQAHLDRVARRRVEAREKRRERREVRMAESLGRMATALELLSSKQDTVIALLQRLADRK